MIVFWLLFGVVTGVFVAIGISGMASSRKERDKVSAVMKCKVSCTGTERVAHRKIVASSDGKMHVHSCLLCDTYSYIFKGEVQP